jgi:hypothetical protein
MDGALCTIHFSSSKFFKHHKSFYINMFDFDELECLLNKEIK